MPVYLDYNASAPLDERVLSVMVDIYRSHYGNADSRTHTFGTQAKEIVSASRKAIAGILDIDSTDLLFTSGSTESNNMAILGMLEKARSTGKSHFVTTSIEHKSVLEAMRHLEKCGCSVDYVSPDESGRIRPEQILERVNERTLLVSVMHVNSETGVIQPIEEIGEGLANTPVYFHIDATQGFGKLNGVLRKTKYDMLSFTSHKVSGPQGTGALVLKRDSRYQRPPLQPLMYGGPQERGFRPGTTPVALVAGFAKAAELAESECSANMEAFREIRGRLMDAISSLDYTLNGDQAHCLPSTVNVSFTGVDAESLFVALKEQYAVSNGSACNSGSHAPSYVLSAMGLSESRINEAVRISWGAKTSVDFSGLAEFIRSVQ